MESGTSRKFPPPLAQVLLLQCTQVAVDPNTSLCRTPNWVYVIFMEFEMSIEISSSAIYTLAGSLVLAQLPGMTNVERTYVSELFPHFAQHYSCKMLEYHRQIRLVLYACLGWSPGLNFLASQKTVQYVVITSGVNHQQSVHYKNGERGLLRENIIVRE